ncbi:MAG: glutamyl-tRNA synthetase [Chlamydiae bacterium SM23_39]|nr:MAG: glutamyl-tRNA synthetase [Chlamydiae bacterium SM23_39]
MKDMFIRTRIAPSPTGDPHVGTLYIALFNYVFAKHLKGKFVLRIEDTDKKRSKKKYEKKIIEALKWGKINWDEGPDIGGEYAPYRQSERIDIYQKYIQKLLNEKKAYKCFATQEELKELRKKGKSFGYDRRYRDLSDEEVKKREAEKQPYTIRLKIPLKGECSFEDKIKGKITIPWEEIDDQILIKSDGHPTYHFANVIDDHLMKISHVIRGEEWISSTPKHILLYEYFNWTPPIFMHMPLLTQEDGKKLSKRRNPTSILYYKKSGYLAEALINFLSLMGYNMKDGSEFYSIDTLIKDFDDTRFGRSNAFFDIKKLKWLNQKYIIETLSEKDILKNIKKLFLDDEILKKIIPMIHTRIKTFGEFFDLCNFLFTSEIYYTEELLSPKKIDKEIAKSILQTTIWSLDEKDDWSGASLEKSSHEIADFFKLKHKTIVMPLLFSAIMGKRFGPPLFDSIDILGKELTYSRFLKAIEFLGGISNKKLEILKKTWEKKNFSLL